MEAAIQELLVQYADDQEELSRSMNDMADPLLPPSQTQLRTVQRHRELLVESERDFFRSKTSLRQALDRQQLLGHVRDDIECVLLSDTNNSSYRAQHASEVQAFLDERSHLERSHRMIDETLECVVRC